MTTLEDLLTQKKKYTVIYADPPWHYRNAKYQDNNRKRSALQSTYRTMKTTEIQKLPIRNITEDNAVCFLWVTDSHLKDGLDVLASWGFQYKTVAFVWTKTSTKGNFMYNVGPYTLKSCEIVLLGTKGKTRALRKANNVKQLVQAVRREHSRKPDEVAKRIETMYGTKETTKIELFARCRRDGWDAWGNEVNKYSTK